jgi:nucleoside-diphosphate-sugar epimerase
MGLFIAVTGGSGRLGQVVIAHLLKGGHRIVSLDRATTPAHRLIEADEQVLKYIAADLNDLPALTETIRGCQAVVHLAAFPGPWGPPPGVVYANNTIASHNVLNAAAALGIKRVCLASSINALGGLDSRTGHFDYFPVDEAHPTYNEDDYSLSKWVLEQQGDSFARRYPDMMISSLRFHALVDAPPEPRHSLDPAEAGVARGLWGWTLIQEGARACELALQADYRGHRAFFITAARTLSAIPTLELAAFAYPKVPVGGDLSGNKSFYDCSLAARWLGWTHANV